MSRSLSVLTALKSRNLVPITEGACIPVSDGRARTLCLRYLADLVGRFGRNRRGNILIMFGLLAFVLMLFVGAAVDVTIAVRFRGALQDAVDAAALAGATKFVGPAGALASEATATKFMLDSIARLPGSEGVTFTVTPFATDSQGTTTAYNCRVVASGRVKTTFLSIAVDYLQVSASATATSPLAMDGGHYEMNGDGSFSLVGANGGGIAQADRVGFMEVEALGPPGEQFVHLTQ
jgi:Flp pilus assembly protein TadG